MRVCQLVEHCSVLTCQAEELRSQLEIAVHRLQVVKWHQRYADVTAHGLSDAARSQGRELVAQASDLQVPSGLTRDMERLANAKRPRRGSSPTSQSSKRARLDLSWEYRALQAVLDPPCLDDLVSLSKDASETGLPGVQGDFDM